MSAARASVVAASKAAAASPPKRSAATAVADLARLAAALATLEARRDLVIEIAERLDALRDTDVVIVDGELAVLATLNGHLDQARTLLGQIRETPADRQLLDRLEAAVDSPHWAAVPVVLEHLTRKEQIRAEAAVDIQTRLGPWTDREAEVKALDRELGQVNAVLPRELSEGRDRLLSLVASVRAQLDAGQLMAAHLSLKSLDEHPSPTTLMESPRATASVPAEEVKDRLQHARDEARRRSGRVQLTVLRGPLDEHRYEYTIMLLAPGAAGHVGVNIQDTTTIVEQDRRFFLDALRSVSGAAYSRLRDSAPAGKGPAAVAMAAPTANSTGLAELQKMGSVFFKLLVPDRMKDELARNPDAQIIVTTNDLELPWELMFDADAVAAETGTPPPFFSLRRPIARMPVGRSRSRVAVRAADGAATGRRIALIASTGDPALTNVAREVATIKARIEQKWARGVQVDVIATGLDDAPSGSRFREVLMSTDYDIVHFAGHAAYDARRPDQSGLLLDGGEVCFAQKIQRLMAGHPLVFLNACETARQQAGDGLPPVEGVYDGDPREGLASAFVYGGALGCIGSLWPVVDNVAADFAASFYNAVLEGQPLGQAMLLARQETARVHLDDPSWAAFVLYGDPAFRWPSLTPG